MLYVMKKLSLALVIILLIAIAIVFELTTLFGMPDNTARRLMLPEFEERRAQWEDANITHYRMTVKSFGGLNFPICPPADLEVRDDKVISITTTGDDPI